MKQIAEIFWNRKWALSLAMGALLGLSWPPFPFPFLVFPAFLLLFRLIDLCDSVREAAYWSYPGFVIWNIIVTYWMVMATVAGGVAAILANAAVMTLPVMVMYLFQKKLINRWLIALAQTASWISYEYLHHQWDLAWPWLAIGNAWANVPELVQYISVTGYLGITVWVLLLSALAYQAFKSNRKNFVIGAAVVSLAFPLLSLSQLQLLNIETDQSVETVVAQPNYDTYQYYGGYEDSFEALDAILAISDSVRTDSTNLVVWPESGIRTNIHSERVTDSTANAVKQQLIKTADDWDITLIAGTRYYEHFSPDNAPAQPRYNDGTPYLTYNAALAFHPDSSLNIYRKYNLVPIVERIPFIHFLNTIDIGSFVNWADIQGFGKGYDDDQFHISSTKTPALICYDSVFPGWVREFVNDGAGFITIITNDGWWGDTGGHEQHFAYARLRAIEFRRWIVRSANNGISGIITPSGSVKVRTEYWTKTAFRYNVPVINEQTFYARFGDWLPISMLFITGLSIVLIVFQNYEKDITLVRPDRNDDIE